MAIRKTKTGRWQVDAEISRGKRVRRTFDRKADAVQFEASIRSKLPNVRAQLNTERDTRRLSELIQLWYDVHGHTLNDGARRLRALQRLAVRLGDPVARSISPALYARDRRCRSESGISDKTLNNELSYIRAVYNELSALGEINYPNPLSRVKQIRIQERELTWLTEQQIQHLLETVRNRKPGSNPHLEPLILLCLATGARWSEAENLGPASLVNDVVTFSNTKSGRVRSVPISPLLSQRLRDHWSKYGPFTSSIGAFRRALAKSGIQLPKGQATHVLRHTFASHFVMKGGNILTLQRILGHSSVKVTMRYAHLAPEHLEEAVKLAPVTLE